MFFPVNSFPEKMLSPKIIPKNFPIMLKEKVL